MKRRERRWVSRRRVKGSASSVCSVTHGLTCVSLVNSVVRETANKRVLDTCENMFHKRPTTHQPGCALALPSIKRTKRDNAQRKLLATV